MDIFAHGGEYFYPESKLGKDHMTWLNDLLNEKNHAQLVDLRKSLSDGQSIVTLTQILTDTPVTGANTNPVKYSERLENIHRCLNILAEQGVQIQNIHSDDVADGDLKATLALMKALRMKYDPQQYSYDNDGYMNGRIAGHTDEGNGIHTSTGSLPGLVNNGGDSDVMKTPACNKPSQAGDRANRGEAVTERPTRLVHPNRVQNKNESGSQIRDTYTRYYGRHTPPATSPSRQPQYTTTSQHPAASHQHPTSSHPAAIHQHPASTQQTSSHQQQPTTRQHPPPAYQHPAASTQHSAASTQQPPPGLQYQNYGPIDAFPESNYATYPAHQQQVSHPRQNSDPRNSDPRGTPTLNPGGGLRQQHRSPSQRLVQQQRDNRTNDSRNNSDRSLDSRNGNYNYVDTRSLSDPRDPRNVSARDPDPRYPGSRKPGSRTSDPRSDYYSVGRKDYDIILGPELKNRGDGDGQSISSPNRTDRRSLTPTRGGTLERGGPMERGGTLERGGPMSRSSLGSYQQQGPRGGLIQRPAHSVQDLRDYEELKRLSQQAHASRDSPPRSSSASICRPNSAQRMVENSESVPNIGQGQGRNGRRSSIGHHVTFEDEEPKSIEKGKENEPLQRALRQYTMESLNSTRNYIEMKPVEPRDVTSGDVTKPRDVHENYYRLIGAKTYNVDDMVIDAVIEHNRSRDTGHDRSPRDTGHDQSPRDHNPRDYETCDSSFEEKLEDPFSNLPKLADPFASLPTELYKSGGIMNVSGSEPSSRSITPPLPPLNATPGGRSGNQAHKPSRHVGQGQSRLPTGDADSDDDDDIISTDTQQDQAAATLRQAQLPRGDESMNMHELMMIRKQLDGLETMYHEVLKLLGVDRDYVITKPADRVERGRKRRPPTAGSSSSSSTFKTRSKDLKNVSRRFSRLESHVVTLARSVAHLSNEMRAQNMLHQELDQLKQELTAFRDRPGNQRLLSNSGSKDWDGFRGWVPSLTNPRRVEKLKRFFGQEPPLLEIFLKKLGYEKFLSNFESEHITMVELPYLTEQRLQSIGVPLGPRLRILQEAQLSFRQENFNIYIV